MALTNSEITIGFLSAVAAGAVILFIQQIGKTHKITQERDAALRKLEKLTSDITKQTEQHHDTLIQLRAYYDEKVEGKEKEIKESGARHGEMLRVMALKVLEGYEMLLKTWERQRGEPTPEKPNDLTH